MNEEQQKRRLKLIEALNHFQIPHQNGWLSSKVRVLRNINWSDPANLDVFNYFFETFGDCTLKLIEKHGVAYNVSAMGRSSFVATINQAKSQLLDNFNKTSEQ
jgi:hypothetical protein